MRGSTAQPLGCPSGRFYRLVTAVLPLPLGDESTTSNHWLVPGSGTTAPLSGTTVARLWAYIFPSGLVGVSFLSSPALPILCPSRRPPLPLPRSASRTSDPWGLYGSSPRRPPPSRFLPMDAGNAPLSFVLRSRVCSLLLGNYLTFRVYCLNYWVEEVYICLLLRLHFLEVRIWLV